MSRVGSGIFFSYPANSDGIEGNWRLGYTPPPNSTFVEDPRNPSEFIRNTIAVYVFSITAFAHYLSLTRLSHSWVLELLQVLAFACFPALPLVQCCSNAFQIFLKVADGAEGSLGYYFAALLGFYANTINVNNNGNPDTPRYFPLIDVTYGDLQQVQHSGEWKSWRWLGRLLFLLANFVVSLLSNVGYIRRVRLTYASGTYVAALGLDHRLGWVELGGLYSCVLSFFSILMGTSWNITSLTPRTYTFAESFNSRVTNTFFEFVLAGVVQDILLLITNRFSMLYFLRYGLSGVSSFLIVAVLALIYFRTRNSFRTGGSTFRGMLLLLSLCVLPVPILQIIYDFAELEEVKSGIYWPWNYRWAEKDRLILNWWVI